MGRLYGRKVAEHKISPQPCCVCCRPNIDSQTTIWLSEYREHLQCRHVEYHFMPNNCNKTAFKALLRAWDCDAWIDWVVFDKLNCCLVLELVSVYSPFTTLKVLQKCCVFNSISKITSCTPRAPIWCSSYISCPSGPNMAQQHHNDQAWRRCYFCMIGCKQCKEMRSKLTMHCVQWTPCRRPSFLLPK